MDRRTFLKTTAGAVGLTAVGSLIAQDNQPMIRNRPNVVLIMTDDQGWGDIHSHGNEVIDTPTLDELAADGARFDRFYVSPVCAPTRASLLTGRYYPRTGVHGVTRGYETMRENEVTFAEVFRREGYATGCFGKWHNGAHYPHHPNGQGFDTFVGFTAGHWNNYFDTELDYNGTPISPEGYITDVLTDYALDFIEENRENNFLCYVPYNAPHSPWQVPDKYFNKYKSRGLDDTLATAYGMVENIDDNVRRILDKLDALELANDTIVIFLTDNGANTDRYDGNMRGRKGSVHEGGVRVPFFIRWPGQISSGRTVEPIAAHIDVLPTLIDLCKIQNAETLPMDGVSLAPLILEEDPVWRFDDRKLYTFRNDASKENSGAVRTQRWRAVYERDETWSLFDMHKDPQEENDVSGKHPKVLSELREAYWDTVKSVTQDGFEPIPTQVGHIQAPLVELPGHEAFLSPAKGEGISYQGSSGWANDWVTNWIDTDSYPYWPIEVVRDGRYEISLLYVCPEEDVGAEFRVEVGGESVEDTIDEAHNPPHLPSPDRVERKEVYEKIWKPKTVGVVELKKGVTEVAVKALSKPGKQVMDLKAVRLLKVR